MNPTAPQNCQAEDPLAKAREIKVTLRSDLHVTRQVQQGDPVYVVHDPISFRTHRLSVFQYRVLASLNPNQNLGENFQGLLAKDEFEASEEKLFIDLISSFARIGMIVMPNSNGAQLFEHHQKVTKAKRRGKILGALFLQIPLVNPDRFLTRTIGRVGWLYTTPFFFVWLVGMAAAGFIVYSRFADLVGPLNGILATKNLPFLWVAFVGLKIWHELGHGYACKKFGGFVPEMGTILIAGTPAAYVDATSAWSFPERYKRLVVMCGGMFFESLVFIPGVFVWAFANSPMLKSCAYQLVVMASLVTVLFNANPLMKFDGYFILSELLGVQNLRPRADAQIKGFLCSTLVGVKVPPKDDSASTKILLVIYGIAATIYKFTLVISIAVMIAYKFPLVGLGLAAFHVLTTVVSGVIKMSAYLLKSKETEPVRGRARLVAAIVLIGLPIAACVLPVPFGVVTQGLVGAEVEHFLNVDTPGEFQQTLVESGAPVSSSTPLIELQNERLNEELAVALASLREAELRWSVIKEIDQGEASRERAAILAIRKEVAMIQERIGKLAVSAPGDGQIARLISQTHRGQFLMEGTPLATIVDGKPVLRTWVNEDQLGGIQKKPGGEVSFRIPGRSSTTYSGRIISVEPAAEDTFQHLALTYLGGGEILIDPSTGEPLEPVFQIDVEPSDEVISLSEHGARVHLNLPREYQSIASWAYQRCLRFVQKVLVT